MTILVSAFLFGISAAMSLDRGFDATWVVLAVVGLLGVLLGRRLSR